MSGVKLTGRVRETHVARTSLARKRAKELVVTASQVGALTAEQRESMAKTLAPLHVAATASPEELLSAEDFVQFKLAVIDHAVRLGRKAAAEHFGLSVIKVKNWLISTDPEAEAVRRRYETELADKLTVLSHAACDQLARLIETDKLQPRDSVYAVAILVDRLMATRGSSRSGLSKGLVLPGQMPAGTRLAVEWGGMGARQAPTEDV